MSRRTLFLDFETRSRADLKKRGGWNYTHDRSTELLCFAGLLLDGDQPISGWLWTPHRIDLRPIVWNPPREWPELARVPLFVGADEDRIIEDLERLARDGVPFAAHNGVAFDRYLWDRFSDARPHWIDTLPRSRRRGLPGGLDKMAIELYGTGKTTGRNALHRLTSPRKDGEFIEPNRDTLSAVMQYCLDDVTLQAAAWVDELGHGYEPPEEWELVDADADINSRGFGFDSDLAAALLRVEREIRSREESVVRELTSDELDASTLRSQPALRKWLRGRGVETDNLKDDTVLAMIQHPMLDPTIRAVLWARIGATRIASAKLGKGIAFRSRDGRLRNSLAYYGGFTGRWGGRGIQPQNLPRPNEDVDANAVCERVLSGDGLTAVIEAASAAKCLPDEVIGTLVRSCIVPAPGKVLGVVDFSAIEARVAAWLAFDDEALDVYRDKRDPYVVMAAGLYGNPYDELYAAVKAKDPAAKLKRQAGKVACLGCQYQMGFDRFAGFAAGAGVDLVAAGISPQQVVEGFRDLRPVLAGSRIGKLHEESGVALRKGGIWRRLGKRVFDVVSGKREHARVARCDWERDGAHLICWLPSGRYLIYRNARIADVAPAWGGALRPTVTYDHVVGQTVTRATTYGGKLLENITQAVSRDFLAIGLVRLDGAGFPVVLHVHDEIVSELDREDDLDEMAELCVDPPAWAVGLPLGVDGFAATRYGKGASKGAKTVKLEREIPDEDAPAPTAA